MSKINFMAFTKKYKYIQEIEVQIKRICQAKTVKYLGLFINDSGTCRKLVQKFLNNDRFSI